MSTLGTLKNNASSKEQPASNGVEAVRNEGGTSTRQWTPQTADGPALPSVDGGIKAWSVIGGAFLALFVQFGLGEFTRVLQAISRASWFTCSHCTHLSCIVLRIGVDV
jgi:hypothetical protein